MKHVLYKKDDRIRLIPKEFDMLVVLAKNSGHVVMKEEIVQEVWRDTFIGDTSLMRNISVLRKILGPDVIETVSKRSYLFVAKTQESTEARPCGKAESVELANATEQFDSISEPTNQSPAVHSGERPNLKGIAISAINSSDGRCFSREIILSHQAQSAAGY
jgi:DNA-binding winged helix-turn-helix (wHTH) protein